MSSCSERVGRRRSRPRVARPRGPRRSLSLPAPSPPCGRRVRRSRSTSSSRWWRSASGTPWSPRRPRRAGDRVLASAAGPRDRVGVGQWIAEARTGATVGNAITGIRTLSALDRSPGRSARRSSSASSWSASARSSVRVGQWVVVASGAWDRTPAQRGWHDKAAGTVVLRARGAVRRSAARPREGRAPSRARWSSGPEWPRAPMPRARTTAGRATPVGRAAGPGFADLRRPAPVPVPGAPASGAHVGRPSARRTAAARAARCR